MKFLIVFYSRTGVTKKVAGAIQSLLGCDTEEIIDLKKRRGFLGFIISCKDAMLKKKTPIKPPEKDPSAYDLIIIGTPVWAWTMSCAVRTYIMQNRTKFKNVAFFCTAGESGITSTFRRMEELSGKKPISVLGLTSKEVVKNQSKDKIQEFIKSLGI